MRPFAFAISIAVPSLLAVACATVPESVEALQWRDLKGDRGTGVRDRDWVECSSAVETRRSSLTECMARKGWAN